MNRFLSLVGALLASLAVGSAAAAAGGTATDQAVSLTYAATHWSSAPVADLTGVDATGDQVAQWGMWYRVDGDTREFPMPPPDSETYADGRVTAIWNNLGGQGFWVKELTYVFDNEGPSGGFINWVVARNDNATPRQLTVFRYLDPDLAASSSGDSGTLVSPRFLKFSDGASRLSYRAYYPDHYQVAASPGLLDVLNDATLSNLNDTGLPFGPGNVTVAYQHGPYTLQPGVSSGMSLVSAFFNSPRDHVKGDWYGLGLSALFGQPGDCSNQYFQWMRRTTQLDMSTYFQSPGSSPCIMGVDDFAGDLADEAVFRDMTTGTTYVGFDWIFGAPTPPLNWKLSATGDFNADGKADILWRNTTSQKLVIWTMNGSAKVGNIVPSPSQAVDVNWEVAGAADFNGDGNRDLLWYNQTSGKIVLWYMNAAVVRTTGLFTNPSAVGNNNWRVRAVGDFGKGAGGIYDTQDIVWQNDTSKKVVVWHMDKAANRTSGVFISPDTPSFGWDVVGPR